MDSREEKITVHEALYPRRQHPNKNLLLIIIKAGFYLNLYNITD
jgi:hypothetical protein